MRHVGNVGAALLLGLWLAAGFGAAAQAQDKAVQLSEATLIRRLLPSVVNITAHAAVPRTDTAINADAESRSPELRVSAGSGFIVDPSGMIVTNWHVLNGAFKIYVTFADGTRTDARVLNAARILDIALLKVDVGHALPAVAWGDSGAVQIGDPVIAIGNPLGIGMSVSTGIVSALNRNIRDTPYDDFIQTDAPINHGNSGGPLFNLDGEVIGVTTALVSPTAASAGLGFAIPSTLAQHVIDRLMRYGWVRPAFLGVKVQQVTPDMAEAMGLAQPAGSIVAWVTEGGPAAAAGMRVGDVILRLGEAAPTDERDLLRQIAASLPGRIVTFSLLRDGKPMELTVTLAEWPRMAWEQRDAPIVAPPPHWHVPDDLGVQVSALTEEIARTHDIPVHPAGLKAVLVTSVDQDSDAAGRGGASCRAT